MQILNSKAELFYANNIMKNENNAKLARQEEISEDANSKSRKRGGTKSPYVYRRNCEGELVSVLSHI